MAIFEKKILLFIKSPLHNLKQVESFLKKRDYDIHIESDIKAAVSRVIETRPNFIFLALDHSNPAIANLPQLIAQASAATIVPYIMSDKKSDIRKFDLSALNPKLRPPISGPAIERLVLKYGKHVISADSPYKQMNVGSIITNSFSSEDSKESRENEGSPEQREKFIHYSSIQKRNEILRNSPKSKLSSTTANGLKNAVKDKIKIPLESLLNALRETEENSLDEQSSSNRLMQLAALNTNNNPPSGPTNIKTYCLSIYSDEWCGYLMITTDAILEFSSIDIIFSDWIKLQFNNLLEVDECDYFEFNDMDSNLIQDLNKNAEYFESVKINNYNLDISFLPIAPNKMALELNEENNLIKIPTDDIPAEAELNFSLHLHLPENKKYLMYTQPNKKFSHEQKNRLLSNKVLTLYTPLNFENEYRKFKFKKNIMDLYKNIIQNNPTV